LLAILIKSIATAIAILYVKSIAISFAILNGKNIAIIIVILFAIISETYFCLSADIKP